MPTYDLPKAVDLFTEQVNIANNLWTVYVAATFTAAGFGTTLEQSTFAARAAITLGFWAFTLGHLHLLRQALGILKTVGAAIERAAQAAPTTPAQPSEFTDVLLHLAKTANRPRTSVAIHLLIDCCVTVAIWAPYLRS